MVLSHLLKWEMVHCQEGQDTEMLMKQYVEKRIDRVLGLRKFLEWMKMISKLGAQA